MPNDREIITTLYRFPGSAGFKELLLANYENPTLATKFNTAFLKAQYCANGLPVTGRTCTPGAKSDNRLLQGGQRKHFFFHCRSWSAFNLESGRWFESSEGLAQGKRPFPPQPKTEQRFGGGGKIPLKHTERDFSSTGSFSELEKEAWKEEMGIQN